MKGSSNVVSAIHNLAKAKAHFESFCREHPSSKGDKLFTAYASRLEWIYKDIITHPFISSEVVEGIKKEWNGDAFQVDAIAEQAALLSPEKRDLVEAIIESLLKGEEIQFTNK